jgi:hypothetical protein
MNQHYFCLFFFSFSFWKEWGGHSICASRQTDVNKIAWEAYGLLVLFCRISLIIRLIVVVDTDGRGIHFMRSYFVIEVNQGKKK